MITLNKEKQILWAVLILFALGILTYYNQQRLQQHAIDTRCSTSYAGQTETLSQLAARPDFFQILGEDIWRAFNCQQKAPTR